MKRHLTIGLASLVPGFALIASACSDDSSDDTTTVDPAATTTTPADPAATSDPVGTTPTPTTDPVEPGVPEGTGGTDGTEEVVEVSGTPVPLSWNNGWVDGASNTVGVQGAFFTASDMNGSTIMPETFEASGDQICVSGEAALVVDMMYGDFWGAVLALNLSQPDAPEVAAGGAGGEGSEASGGAGGDSAAAGGDAAGGASTEVADEVLPYDASANNVIGFRYRLSAVPEAGELRIQYNTFDGVEGVPFCQTVTELEGDFLFSEALAGCWDATASETPTLTQLKSIEFQLATNIDAAYPYDFCIEELSAIVAD